MAHANLIQDTAGNLLDIQYYCSDWCSRFDMNLYDGWNGCHELYEPTNCHTCQKPLDYYKEMN